MRYSCLALLAAVAAPALRAEDGPPAAAKAVIAKAVEASGGEALLKKYPAAKMAFTANLSVMGMDIELKGNSVSSDAGKMKMTMTADIMGAKLSILQMVNGKTVVMKQSLNGQELPSPDAAKEELLNEAAIADVSKFYPLLDSKRFAVTAEADDKVEDKEVSVLKVSILATKKEMTMYFDKKTGLLAKTKRMGMGEAGKEVLRETLYNEYQKTEGIQTPLKETVFNDGAKYMTITFTEVKLLEKVDDKEFSLDD